MSVTLSFPSQVKAVTSISGGERELEVSVSAGDQVEVSIGTTLELYPSWLGYYVSDYSTTGAAEFSGQSYMINQSIGGEIECLQITVTATSGDINNLIKGSPIKDPHPQPYAKTLISFDYYIPSSNSLVDGITYSGTKHQTVTLDTWLNFELEVTNGLPSFILILFLDGASSNPADASGDVVYLKNLVYRWL